MFFHYLKHTQHQPIRLFAGFFSALQFFFSSLSFDLSFVIALNKQPFRAIESCAICNWSLGWNVNLILILYAIGNKHVNKRAPLWFTTHRNRLIVCVRPGFFLSYLFAFDAQYLRYGEWLGSRWEWALLRHQFHENSLERLNLEPEIAAQWFIHTVKLSNQFIHIILCSKRRRRRKKTLSNYFFSKAEKSNHFQAHRNSAWFFPLKLILLTEWNKWAELNEQMKRITSGSWTHSKYIGWFVTNIHCQMTNYLHITKSISRVCVSLCFASFRFSCVVVIMPSR